MEFNKNPFNILSFKCICSTLLVQLFFVPTIYIFVVNTISESDNSNIGWYFITVRILRSILVIIVALLIRRKNNSILMGNKKQRKTYAIVISHGIVIIILLNLLEISQDLYGNLAGLIGIYDMHLFLTVLCEELFANYLIFHMLLCLAIVFFYKPAIQNSRELS